MQQVDELLNDDVLEQSIEAVVQLTQARANGLTRSSEPGELVRMLVSIESDASVELADLWRTLDFPKPRGVAIGKNLARAYEIVADRRAKVETDLFAPARQRIHRIVREVAHQSGSSFNQRLRVTTLLDRDRASALKNARKASATARTAAQDVAMRVAVLSEDIVADLDQRLRAISVRSNEFPFEQSDDEEVDRFLMECQHEVSLASEFLSGALESLGDLFRSLDIDWDSEAGILTGLDERQALDEEIETLKAQADDEMELAQLGLSVDIINHEFLGTVNAIRKGLRSLDSWASINPDMVPLRNILASNFNHLENFLNLFTPLRKRFNAERTSIQGTEIMDYLRSIFLERLRQDEIEFNVSEEFRKKQVKSYASVILPAFTNLVDNALFWLKDRPRPRIVSLDIEEHDWLISDNGPGIPDRYRDSVFAAGFTTRPGGRGLGLYIARQVLERHGFTLTIEGSPKLGMGTTFRIGLKKEGTQDG